MEDWVAQPISVSDTGLYLPPPPPNYIYRVIIRPRPSRQTVLIVDFGS